MRLRVRTVALALGAALALAGAHTRAQAPASIPSPEEFFGFPMGAEQELAAWNEMVDYFQLVDQRSDRVLVQELGKTTLGKPYLLAIVSSPETIRGLPRYQRMQKQLADPRRTPEADAAAIVEQGKVVVLIGANVHATEIGTSQMMNDLLHKLASEQAGWVNRLLDNAIVLLIPSQNPDGQQMVVEWYRKNLGTPYEDTPLPDLYHKYAGHDNNRDSYMLTQVESQHLNRVMYQDWLPEVYLDKHQMGSTYARIFVPPFKNPPNPNVDPLVWSEINMLGQAMAAKLHEAGKAGVLWGELYSGFWEGANSTNPWWHNMVALLTEVASPRLASSIYQEQAAPGQPARASLLRSGFPGLPNRMGEPPLPPPGDVQPRMTYPRPWTGGAWSLADAVEYQMLATLGLLEAVANNREMLKRNFYAMNKRAIERFRQGSPYAYLVPARQRDPGAVAKLLQLLQAEAAEVHVADQPFTADGRTYPAGTYVLLLAQPFGRWVKDMLEPQQYPDIRWPYPTAPLDKPYDVTAWSLGMLLGVETIVVDRPFEATLTLLTEEAEAPRGGVTGRGESYVLPHEFNNSFVAMNRLLGHGADVAWLRQPGELGGERYDAGAIVVSGPARSEMERLAADLHLQIAAVDLAARTPLLPIRAPRLAVFEPWGGSLDAGWTRWVLDQHEFSYRHVRTSDVRQPKLIEQFDVLIIPETPTADIIRGLQGRHVRPEHRGGIGAEGLHHLREFVDQGGTLITLGNAASFAIEHLAVPLVNVVRDASPESFYCPGCILRVSVDASHPIAYGMPLEADAMFVNNGSYLPADASASSSRVIPVVRYPETPLWRSGWLIGDDKLRGAGAVVEVATGKGRVIVHGFRVQHRGQTWGTFRLLFNSIFYGPAVRGRLPADTTFDQQG